MRGIRSRLVVIGMFAGASLDAQVGDTLMRVCRPTMPPTCVPAFPTDSVGTQRGRVPFAIRPAPEDGRPYFEFMVDKPVTEAIGTGRAVYPPELKLNGITGTVLAQFVVDTLGRVEEGSFKVLRSTHPGFTAAIRDAVPAMRFNPAEVAGKKVRQLVQQPFVFALSGQPVPELPAMPEQRSRNPIAGGAPAPAPASGKVMGWSLTQRLTVDSGNGSRRTSTTTTSMGAGGVLRQEFSSDRTSGMPMVNLIDSATGTSTLIMSLQRTATRMPTLPVPASEARLIRSDTVSWRVDTIPGTERILGMPTTRVRSAGVVRTTESLGAVTCSRSRRLSSEMWIVSDSPIAAIQWQLARTALARLGPLSDEALRSQLDRPPTKSSVVRTVGVDSGRGVVYTSEVLSYSLGELDAALFAVPEGYTVSVMPPMERARPAPMEDVQARSFWQRFDTTRVEADGSRASCRTSQR